MNPAISTAKISHATPLPPMSSYRLWLRSSTNLVMRGLCAFATLIAVVPLFLVLWYVIAQGIHVMNVPFFTHIEPTQSDPEGGMKHAILGTLMMVGFASCLGLPVGILGGIYLSEFGQNRFGFWVRFATDVLNGVPSIIIGVFVYAIAVLPVTNATRNSAHPITFSALAGGLALGIMMVPTVMRTTEEIVRLVPQSLREGALALGDTRWHSTLKIVLNAAKGGIVTGVLLAVARISGETAPLLFTASSSLYVNTNPLKATASLPAKIYEFATSSDNHLFALAWGGSFVLVAIIFVLSLLARYATRSKFS